MFTNFAQRLNGLFGIPGFPPEAAELLITVLGQCNANLTHRGDITIEGDIIGGASAGSYALAVATWVRASGHGSYVECRAASDPIGTPTSDATTFLVYLPRANAALDPNVYAGDVLQYVTVGGVRYAIGETYLDDRIGTIKYLHHSTIPHGWTQYTEANGKFIRCGSTPGTLGGSDTHTHTGDATVDFGVVPVTGTTAGTNLSTTASSGTTGTTSLTIGTASGETDPAATGITVEDHPDHKHEVPNSWCRNAEADGADLWHATVPIPSTGLMLDTFGAPLVYNHVVVDPEHTHTFDDHSHSVSPEPHDHSIGSHTHPVSPDPHAHDAGTLEVDLTEAEGEVTIDPGDNVPAYIEEIAIIRVAPDGSYT